LSLLEPSYPQGLPTCIINPFGINVFKRLDGDGEEAGVLHQSTPPAKLRLNKSGECLMTAGEPDLTPLDPEDRSKAYAKYYRNPVPQDPAHLTKMDAPCDPLKAIWPEQMNDLLNPGDLPVEVGWCNRPTARVLSPTGLCIGT
jgi:hypothetical protein